MGPYWWSAMSGLFGSWAFQEATWKESGLWYLTRPMRENEKAEIFIFQEDSQYGIMEGKVIFIETK